MIAQKEAFIQSHPRILQIAILKKYGESQNNDTLHLKRLCRYEFFRNSLETIKLRHWTRKRGRFFQLLRS